MKNDEIPAAITIHELTEQGRLAADHRVEQLLGKAEDFVRDNPWVAVAGAAVLGGVLSAMTRGTPVRKDSSRAAVRDWLEDSRASLPTKKQFKSMARSAGLPTTRKQLEEKLRDL